ncbi:hypothetical protein DL769_000929 [Monosporascus sp. CRB-8-3]|nr:hypothetical protein DL769_000929 [Monosporascus sp. CRB-8-3]
MPSSLVSSPVTASMTGKASLQMLPPELKSLLLMNVDIDSLPAIAKTCRAFYETYRNQRGPITYSITSNALGGVLPLAIASYAASGTAWRAQWPLPSGDVLMKQVHEFGRKYLDRTKEDPPIRKHEFSFAIASEMIAFHRIVEEWTPRYIGWAMDKAYRDLEEQSSPGAPTVTEVTRVQGALYAIQICRELLPFEIHQDGVRDKPFELLWHYFAPWENTLAWNIVEFLYEIIGEKYPDDEDLADHVIHDLIDDLAARWLSKYGIRGLANLGDDDYIRSSFKGLADDCLERPFRSECFCSDLVGCSWLKLAGGDIKIRSLDIDHIVARYAQEENGARDYWFFCLVDDLECFRDTRGLPGEAHVIAVWWDLPRINAAITGVLPSMEKMQAMTKNNEYDASHFTLETDTDYYQELGF